LASAKAGKMYADADTCTADNYDELKDAVEVRLYVKENTPQAVSKPIEYHRLSLF
jgi:hypothetical protein